MGAGRQDPVWQMKRLCDSNSGRGKHMDGAGCSEDFPKEETHQLSPERNQGPLQDTLSPNTDRKWPHVPLETTSSLPV